MIRQSISFTVSQHKALEHAAKRDGSSIGEVVRQLVDGWLAHGELSSSKHLLALAVEEAEKRMHPPMVAGNLLPEGYNPEPGGVTYVDKMLNPTKQGDKP